ncbi:MAG: epoxide hydrolase family protein [Pseudomonadota bacterium]
MSAVEPFAVPLHEEEAAWIHRRVAAYRWFEEPADAGWAYGANQAYMKKLQGYWLEGFDWPAAVAALNRHPHYRAAVAGGLTLHFIHRPSPRADAIPLLISHGWPGSVLEFTHIIDRLAAPQDPAQPAFHVVAPSLPGYAWSDKPASPMGPRSVARLYDRLMTDVLGYSRYLAQGGDWGCLISAFLGLEAPAVRAIHINGYGLRSADMTPRDDAQHAWLARAGRLREQETAYLYLQATKPQSLAYAMMDSPLGVAAWFAEKFCAWGDKSGGDQKKGASDPPFSLDWLLANIMVYLTTRSFATASWLYRGLFAEGGFAMPPGKRVKVPVGVANFPKDLLAFPPRAMVERGYNVTHWTDMPRGGHFASLEEPDLFLADLRAFAQSL